MDSNITAVILAGGLGTRIREETEFKPKPMVEIGGRPIIWHIMKQLSLYGVTNFVICVGYKGDVIRDYFLNYRERNSDFTVSLNNKNKIVFHSDHQESDWKVTVAETGASTNTGGRILAIKKHIKNQRFICTYGDGVANVDIRKLVEFHLNRKTIATVTAVRPLTRFGVMELDTEEYVTKFREKPQSDGWINGGFFVFEPTIFDFINHNDILENEPLQKLSKANQLSAFKHTGFWQPMDTFRESKILNDLWESGNAPWREVSK